MTVCIAAACRDEDDNPAVVLCCDEQGTKSNWISSDNVKKIQWIGKKFAVMLAGDLGAAKELLSNLNHEFNDSQPKSLTQLIEEIGESMKNPRVGGDDEDLRISTTLNKIRAVIRSAKHRAVDDYIWNRWGMNYNQFRSESSKLPELDFQDTLRRVEEIDIGASLIIVGLLRDEAMLIHVDQYTSKVSWLSNYVVIGSGTPIAESLMAQYDYSEELQIDNAMVIAFEAKVASEKSPGVGRTTVMEVLTRKGRRTVSYEAMDTLWSHFREREIPMVLLPEQYLEDPEAYSDEAENEDKTTETT